MAKAGINMTVKEENFRNLAFLWENYRHYFNAPFFMHPRWLESWWDIFNPGGQLYLRSLWNKEKLCGIAPLYVYGDTAYFIGSNDFFDYRDFLICRDGEGDFYSALLHDLRREGIGKMILECLRPDSSVFTGLFPREDVELYSEENDVSFEMELPADWQSYLNSISKKQRHEIRRKLRRLQEKGEVSYKELQGKDISNNDLRIFFEMFVKSREDKAEFLTPEREMFFHRILDRMARENYLRMGCLELNNCPVGYTLHFVYDNRVFLYNSAHDIEYRPLSIGLMTKVFCIWESIEREREIFEFLKGREIFKSRLGGREVPLYKCTIKLL